MKRLCLLDGMAIVYRAFFVFIRNPILTSRGFNTSAIFGYVNTILHILEREQPTHLAVAFDTPEPTERHRIFEAYKAKREAMPEDLSAALPFVFRVTEAFNIPALTLPGYEADDVIGTLARRAEREGFETLMVTPDKDYCQLVDQNTYVLKPPRGNEEAERLGVPEVLEQWEVERVEQVIDVLGLWGDAVDNVPGVPGIGEKTAKALIQRYGSIENLLAHTHELKGKQKENVETFAEQALLSKRLVTIKCDVPLEVSLDALERREPDKPRLQELFRELEFRTLGRRVFGDSWTLTANEPSRLDAATTESDANGDDDNGESDGSLEVFDDEAPLEGEAEVVSVPTGPVKRIGDIPHEYRLVTSRQERVALIAELESKGRFCFDTETTGLQRNAELVGLSFSTRPHTGYFVPVPGNPDDARALVEEFRAVFENPNIEKIGHNMKFDLGILLRHGVAVRGRLLDTMLAHALVEPGMRHSMDYLAQVYLAYEPVSITSLIGERSENQRSMRDVPLDALADYAAEDADVTLQLWERREPMLHEKNAERVFYEVESPLVPALAAMESDGVRIDVDALRALSAQLDVDIAALERQIHEGAGRPFHIDSPKQLGEVLFDELKLDPNAKKTKTGQYSTREQVLSRLAESHAIVEKVLRFREYRKLKSTYVDMLPGAVSPETGRIHTHYNQLVTVTGRMQSHSPNLQNIPIRTDRGREIRRAFVPRSDGFLILAADYSQIELRIVAALSQDNAMLDAFQKGVDIHRETASRVFGVPPDDVTPEMRRKAKMVNFGVTYGMTAFGLAQRLNIGRTEAKEIIDAYFAQYPGVRRYLDETIAFARKNGYVETVTGRRRYLRDINSKNATARSGEERNAINTPIQGTAADMIKIAMANIYRELTERDLKSRMILQIHDELVFDLYKPEQEVVTELVERRMKTALPMNVPIVVEMGVGANWLDAH
jgi:DNA polymerase-1